MTQYENLLNIADTENVAVMENYDMSGTRIKGLYCDGTVAISDRLSTNSEKSCVLSEELGHHYTTSGNIIDQSKVINRKQELLARVWAYNKLVGLSGIIKCNQAGCKNLFEMAEHLDVTEDFLQDALSCYKSKYGTCAKVDNYVIFFEPSLCVFEVV